MVIDATDRVLPLAAFIKQLIAAQFWGSLTLKFERGEVVNIRKEENIKPSELSGNPRLNDARKP